MEKFLKMYIITWLSNRLCSMKVKEYVIRESITILSEKFFSKTYINKKN